MGQFLCENNFPFLWNVFPGEPLLGCRVSPSLILKGTAEPGPAVAAAACVCSHSEHERSRSWAFGATAVFHLSRSEGCAGLPPWGSHSHVCDARAGNTGQPPTRSFAISLSNSRILCECVHVTVRPARPPPRNRGSRCGTQLGSTFSTVEWVRPAPQHRTWGGNSQGARRRARQGLVTELSSEKSLDLRLLYLRSSSDFSFSNSLPPTYSRPEPPSPGPLGDLGDEMLVQPECCS